MTLVPYIGIRILALGQKNEANLAAFSDLRQGGLECPPCGSSAGPVAVETEEHLFGETEEAVEMVVGCGSSERGDAKIDTVPGQAGDIHISLDDDKPFNMPNGLTGLVQAIEFPAFVKQHGFRGVQIFWFLVSQHTAAEADATTS